MMTTFKKHRNKTYLLLLAVLIPSLVLTITALLQAQRLQQSAQTMSSPPLYGCLHVGEADKTLCGTKLGTSSWTKELSLHGRPIEKQQTVYYGDRLTGSLLFSNVGDQPIWLKNIGIAAKQVNGNTQVDFLPANGNLTLEPKKDLSIDNASYRFSDPNPKGDWIVSANIIDSEGQSLQLDSNKKTVTVNSTCTALRVEELTDTDKANIKTLCQNNPTSPLCTSRQYCEIFQGKGPNCEKSNVSEEKYPVQCDKWIVPAQGEQDILEELCKEYPDTDACERFCKRSIQSSICPKVMVWVDKKAGKEVFPQPGPVKTTKAYENITFVKATGKAAVAGAKIALGPMPGGGMAQILPPSLPPAAPPANPPAAVPATTAPATPAAPVAAPAVPAAPQPPGGGGGGGGGSTPGGGGGGGGASPVVTPPLCDNTCPINGCFNPGTCPLIPLDLTRDNALQSLIGDICSGDITVKGLRCQHTDVPGDIVLPPNEGDYIPPEQIPQVNPFKPNIDPNTPVNP